MENQAKVLRTHREGFQHKLHTGLWLIPIYRAFHQIEKIWNFEQGTLPRGHDFIESRILKFLQWRRFQKSLSENDFGDLQIFCESSEHSKLRDSLIHHSENFRQVFDHDGIKRDIKVWKLHSIFQRPVQVLRKADSRYLGLTVQGSDHKDISLQFWAIQPHFGQKSRFLRLTDPESLRQIYH